MKLIKYLVLLITITLLLSCADKDKKLRLGIIAPSTDHFPVGLAFENELLDKDMISIFSFNSGWEVNEAIAAGRLDLAIMPFTYGWQSVSEGKDLKIISFFERESDGIITNKDILSIEELDGKKIGVLRASTLDVFVHLLIDDFNINPDLVYFRTPTEMAMALKSNLVDALSFYVPAIFEFDEDFHVLMWYSELFPEHPCCDLIATQWALDHKSEMIGSFMTGISHSCDLINNHHDIGTNSIQKQYGLSRNKAAKTLQQTKFILGLDTKGIEFQQRVADKMLDLGYLRNKVGSEEVFYDYFGKK